jgi:hypothetical protein
MERMSNTWGPFYFTDKHYPESNGFYECEMAHSISEDMAELAHLGQTWHCRPQINYRNCSPENFSLEE